MENRMSTIALARPGIRTISLDALLCAAVVAVPALSHAAAFPFYLFDPMRLLLFVAILGTSRRNALLMAVWMPLLAMMTSGHPVFPKVVLIQGELVLNTLLFHALIHRGRGFFPAAAVSVIASKAAYYGAKFVLLRAAWLGGDLVATAWTYQAATLLFILLAGGAVWYRKGLREGFTGDRDARAQGRS
jgi:hypothetical protein